mmetsp:Transcript_113367/g.177161  ORF Transcript_113367/g.177161 Transcript_113367/m.177161 type:complete len:263 (+) Transcript_113367:27-815(+)
MRGFNPLELKPVLVEARAAWSPGAPPPFCPTSGRTKQPLSARLPPLSARNAAKGQDGDLCQDAEKTVVRARSEGSPPSKQLHSAKDSQKNNDIDFTAEEDGVYGTFGDLRAEVLQLVQRVRRGGERLTDIEQQCRAKAKDASQLKKVLKVAKAQSRQRSASPVGNRSLPPEKKLAEYKQPLNQTDALIESLRNRLAARLEVNDGLQKQIAALRTGSPADGADDTRSVMSAEDVDEICSPASRAESEHAEFDLERDMILRVTF